MKTVNSKLASQRPEVPDQKSRTKNTICVYISVKNKVDILVKNNISTAATDCMR